MCVKMQGKERGANIDSRKGGGEIGHEGQKSKSFRRAGQKSKAATTTTQAFVGLKDELQFAHTSEARNMENLHVVM